MSKKIRVGVLFGGRSAEHEVSIQSAINVVQALDRTKYEVVLIGIDKHGCWHLEDGKVLQAGKLGLATSVPSIESSLALQPGGAHSLMRLSTGQGEAGIDVVFPLLHGTYGEDGTVQGMLKLANVPFVGAEVLGSALGMDKEAAKRLLREANIPTAKFIALRASAPPIDFNAIQSRLGLPVFVKPANAGSSVGVSKVETQSQYAAALALAFQYDHKALVEEAVVGREIECAVLGNEHPIASVAGEIVPLGDFYSYQAKYLDENGARLVIPAELSAATLKTVQERAVATFKTLCVEGMARVDFFLRKDGEVLVNELNSIPGFTRQSMFPKLWEASGVSYTELTDRLIQLALERHARDSKLRTSHPVI